MANFSYIVTLTVFIVSVFGAPKPLKEVDGPNQDIEERKLTVQWEPNLESESNFGYGSGRYNSEYGLGYDSGHGSEYGLGYGSGYGSGDGSEYGLGYGSGRNPRYGYGYGYGSGRYNLGCGSKRICSPRRVPLRITNKVCCGYYKPTVCPSLLH